MVSPTNTNVAKCSFCGKPHNEVGKLIAGPGVYICDNCIVLSKSVLDQELLASRKNEKTLTKVPRPTEVKKHLDQYCIGQEHAKKILAVAVRNHYKRILRKSQGEKGSSANPVQSLLESHADVEIEKSNILLIGPTGSGKTHLARTLARMLDVPFAIADATTLTEAGYVGDDVENVILRLLRNAEYDVERAQRGIIYIDEIDKIARKSEKGNAARDVSGEGVQQALLKILEGSVCHVPPQGGRKHPNQEYVHVDTSNILFICGGAFVGLDQIIQRRIGEHVVGFHPARHDRESDKIERRALLRYVEPEDLLTFGLIPEFIGRLPIVTVLSELTEDDLISILTEPRNALVRQYGKLLAMEGVDLQFSPEALRAIAAEAIKKGTGARALRGLLEKLLLEVMFDVPERTDVAQVKITRPVVQGAVNPLIRRKTSKAAA